MKWQILIFIAFIWSCSPHSNLASNPYVLNSNDRIKSSGIYYGENNLYDPEMKITNKEYPYLKFYDSGFVVRGIFLNDNSFKAYTKGDFEIIPKTKIFYTIIGKSVYIEVFNGYSSKYEYEVYEISDSGDLVLRGISSKVGGKITANIKSMVMKFASF